MSTYIERDFKEAYIRMKDKALDLEHQHKQMRDAINDVELALNGLEIDSVVRLFETADDSVMVKVPLGALRQLARSYPELNRIINDPAFVR